MIIFSTGEKLHIENLKNNVAQIHLWSAFEYNVPVGFILKTDVACQGTADGTKTIVNTILHVTDTSFKESGITNS